MKYSYRLLKELSGTKKSAEQLAKLLMVHAFEVEGIEKFSHGIEGTLIGHVVGLAQHPDADKLRVAQVEVGKKDIRTIVCGAPNIAEGQKVVVALPGTQLPGGIEIKVAKLRGVESNGMICSAKELGLGDDPGQVFLEKGKVAFQPGVRFGEQWAQYLRLNFATSPEVIEEAIERTARTLH